MAYRAEFSTAYIRASICLKQHFTKVDNARSISGSKLITGITVGEMLRITKKKHNGQQANYANTELSMNPNLGETTSDL